MTSLVRADDIGIPSRLELTSLTLEAGSVSALVGPNGSGKTSLLNALAAIPPAIGDVTVSGVGVRRQPPSRRQGMVGLLTADRTVSWPLSGRALLTLGLAVQRDTEEVIARLLLTPLLARRVDRLSSGERARLLLGRLLLSDPQLLLLDEPLANLDPYWQLAVMELLRERTRGERATVVAIHDLGAAVRWADRLLLMERGGIAWDGPAKALQASGEADRVFGARWTGAEWVSPMEGPQSLP